MHSNLDTLPTDVLVRIVCAASPKPYTRNRLLLNLVKVNSRLRKQLLKESRRQIWISSRRQISVLNDAVDVLAFTESIVVENEIPLATRLTLPSLSDLPYRRDDGLGRVDGAQIEGLIRRAPCLRELKIQDCAYATSPFGRFLDGVDYNKLISSPPHSVSYARIWPVARASLTHRVLLELDSVFIRDTFLDTTTLCGLFNLQNDQIKVTSTKYRQIAFHSNNLAFCRHRRGSRCSAVAKLTAAVDSMRPCHIRLAPIRDQDYRTAANIPTLSESTLSGAEAVQITTSSAELDQRTEAYVATMVSIPAVYLNSAVPVLFHFDAVPTDRYLNDHGGLATIRFLQLARVPCALTHTLLPFLSSLKSLRAVFLWDRLQPDCSENHYKRNSRQLVAGLEERGINVVFTPPDDDEYILPAFLDYLRTHEKDKTVAEGAC
ncbi:hypothetical protein JCM3774_002199 [Rhodotorula dairenensis]